MKKTLKIDPYLEGLIAKIVERLVGLEKKMDLVIAQTAARSSAGSDPTQSFQNAQPQKQPRRDRVLYEAICADCSKVCEVPFKPSEDRAVYCKECFSKRRQGASGKSPIVLTPVVLPPKPVSKLGVPPDRLAPARQTPPKAKKNPAVKKSKKKK